MTDNLFLLSVLGGIAIVFTIIIYITGEKKGTVIKAPSIRLTIAHFTIMIFLLIYFLRLMFMFISGLLSDFLFETIIGFFCALLPLLIYLSLRWTHSSLIKEI